MNLELQNNSSFDFGNIGSVALVGSSGCVLDSEYGQMIDSHDTIIRFNAARVAGYEKYVGSRTDIRIMNGHCFAGTSDPVRFEKHDPNFISSLRNEHFFVKGYNGPEFHRGVLSNLNKNHINFLSERYIQWCGSFLERHASVGFIGLMIAVTASDNIAVFGFDHGQIEDSRRHYWEAVRSADNWKTGQSHSFNSERIIFKKYEESGVLKIYR